MRFVKFCCLGLGAVFIAGCATVDHRDVRREHAHTYPERLAATTARAIPGGTLDLQRAIRLAWNHNLELELGRIRLRLRELDRRAAFSYFLPAVNLRLSRTGTDNPREILAGNDYVAMSDQHIDRAVLSFQQGVFIPQAWMMYRLQAKGVAIQELLEKRVRQLIALQATARYLGCLAIQARNESLRRAVDQAAATVRETRALVREGLALPSDLQFAEVRRLSRETELRANRRAEREARARLLETLGLSPTAELQLEPVDIAPPPSSRLADLLAEALVGRLELHAADRAIDLQKDEVRRTLAAFLPGFGITGGLTFDSDSFLRYGQIWDYGLIAVLTVFDGFRNVAAYRAAKVKHRQAFIQREQRCLAIILEVIAACRAEQDARDQLKLARAAYAALAARAREIAAHRREGLVRESEYLDILDRRDRAEARVHVLEFQHALCLAVLRDVTGRGLVNPNPSKDKNK